LTIRAVLFDLGNTLYQNPYKTFQKILGTHGIAKTTKEIEEAFEDKENLTLKGIVGFPHTNFTCN